MMIAKNLLLFAVQLGVVGFFVARLWAWRRTERGHAVLDEIGARLAFWLLMLLLTAGIAASAWFNLRPLLGIKQ